MDRRRGEIADLDCDYLVHAGYVCPHSIQILLVGAQNSADGANLYFPFVLAGGEANGGAELLAHDIAPGKERWKQIDFIQRVQIGPTCHGRREEANPKPHTRQTKEANPKHHTRQTGRGEP